MAHDIGKESEEDNPFSLLSFFKKGDIKSVKNESHSFGNDIEVLYDLPNIPSTSHTDETTNVTSSSRIRKVDRFKEDFDLTNDHKKKENPFSFKRFLASESRQPGITCTGDTLEFDFYHGNNEIGVTSTDHLSMVDSQLVENLDVVVSNSKIQTSQYQNDGHFYTNGKLRHNNLDLSDNRFHHPKSKIKPKTITSICLPDFLSDTTCASEDTNELFNLEEYQLNDKPDPKLLQNENQTLKQQLHECRQWASSISKRLSEKTKELEEMQNHDLQETKDLENMIYHVEANLEKATCRALKAESKVSELEETVQRLQNQLSVITMENEDLRTGNKTISAIKERTAYASDTLFKAVDNAEKRLKDMLNGVHSLKILADVLSSVDKIREPSTNETDDR